MVPDKVKDSAPQDEEDQPVSTTRIQNSEVRSLRTDNPVTMDSEGRTIREIGENRTAAIRVLSSIVPTRPYLKLGRQIEIVRDISDPSAEPHHVQTEGIINPAPLAYAVKHQVLECVREQQWWEMLERLDLSESGEHAIYVEGTEGQYPHLLACARLLSVDPENAENNLFRSDYFRSEEWRPRGGREELREAIESNYPVQNDYGIKIDYDAIPLAQDVRNVGELEEGIVQAIGPEHMTEIVRLSFDTKILMDNPGVFFDAMVDISEGMAKSGKPFAFAIVESPIFSRLKQIEGHSKKKCFFPLSRHKITGEEKRYKGTTHKLLLFNGNTAKWGRALQQSSSK